MTSEEQANRDHAALVALRDAHSNMAEVLRRINVLENTLRSAINGLDNAARFMPKLYESKGADVTVFDKHVQQTNELRKVLIPNG
jgi:hypothetical protein